MDTLGIWHRPVKREKPPSPPTLSTHAQRGRAGRRMRRPHPFPTVRRAGVRCGLRLRGKERPCSWPPPGCPARWQACFACAAPAPPPTHTHGGPADQWSARGGGQTRPARVRRVGPLSPPTPPRGGPLLGRGTVVLVGSGKGWSWWVVKTPPPPTRARRAALPAGPRAPIHITRNPGGCDRGGARGGGVGGEGKRSRVRFDCSANRITARNFFK